MSGTEPLIAAAELQCFNAQPAPRLQLPHGCCSGTGTIQPGEAYRRVEVRGEIMVFCMACCGEGAGLGAEQRNA